MSEVVIASPCGDLHVSSPFHISRERLHGFIQIHSEVATRWKDGYMVDD